MTITKGLGAIRYHGNGTQNLFLISPGTFEAILSMAQKLFKIGQVKNLELCKN